MPILFRGILFFLFSLDSSCYLFPSLPRLYGGISPTACKTVFLCVILFSSCYIFLVSVLSQLMHSDDFRTKDLQNMGGCCFFIGAVYFLVVFPTPEQFQENDTTFHFFDVNLE